MNPPLHDLILDDDTVGQLFFDVGAAAELVGVTVKRLGAQRAEGGEVTLEDAQRLFAARAVGGVQLRYRFAGEEWWDTLAHTPVGVRLVRISHTRALAANPEETP